MLTNDKFWVIWAVTIICLVAMVKIPDAKEIVGNALTGLFGIAVGYSLKKGE